MENGPKVLESLFPSIVFHSSAPVLIADDDRCCLEASIGASMVLGLPRASIIGRSFDEFVAPGMLPVLSERWRAFLEVGEQVGVLPLLGADGARRDLEYKAKGNVLPGRHLLALRDKTTPGGPAKAAGDAFRAPVPSEVRDYAFFLLDLDGEIAVWYAGAERLFGYKSEEAIGQHVSLLYAGRETHRVNGNDELKRAAGEGHLGDEGWHVKKNGSRFWANVITLALKNENGDLQGFARVARDFSDRYESDEKLRRELVDVRRGTEDEAVAGIAYCEFDRIPDASNAFLQLVGYSREDLLAGRMCWPDLTPPEYFSLDELAYEEGLRFGACTPFEKELIRKDGTRVPVLVSTSVLKVSPFRWIAVVRDLRDSGRIANTHKEVAEAAHSFAEMVGTSPLMRRVMGQVEVVAPTGATVLVLGETGTGKELIARAVHQMSPRRDFPFISLNCAAIPTGLLESELFGHEKGAFTGALSSKIGRFEMAKGGTLFLDEVGDIPLDLQPKLLRALQEKAFERLGGTKPIPTDVRLVAATNRNLNQMMRDKLFRSDLYYRLKVFPITSPPLRDRPADIPLLVRHFTRKYAAKMNRRIDVIPPETMNDLVSWPWPGNVRELEHFIERSVILSRGRNLSAPLAELRAESGEGSCGLTLEEMERDYIQRVLRETRGVVSAAAARLGMPRTTLNALMKKLGISRGDQ